MSGWYWRARRRKAFLTSSSVAIQRSTGSAALAARNSDFVNFANANAAAMALVNEDLRSDTGIYPTPEVKARLQPSLAKSAEFTRALNRAWTRFMTGR